jgi:hypothetical protein
VYVWRASIFRWLISQNDEGKKELLLTNRTHVFRGMMPLSGQFPNVARSPRLWRISQEATADK